MLLGGFRGLLSAQQMTTQAPPSASTVTLQASTLPDDPDTRSFPDARPVTKTLATDLVSIESAGPQTYKAGVYTLDRDVVILYRDRRVQADHIEYDSNAGEITATGHLLVTIGENKERIAASHGVYNLKTSAGRFYDVSGSVDMGHLQPVRPAVYSNDSPFLFTGRLVVKTGPHEFDVYDGTVTSCQFDKPDWVLTAAHFSVDAQQARAHNSTFRLLNVPILFLPYVTRPVDSGHRESGFLIPTLGYSKQRGVYTGEQFYVVLNRSADLTVGAEYYSAIGFSQVATLRYRGPNLDSLTMHYSGVLDRRAAPLNHQGEEVVVIGRYDKSEATRAAMSIDYLSSYIYREAFSDNFNQAVTSDIVSTAYVSHHTHGMEFAGLADRYQGIKLIAQGNLPQQQINIFHAPTLSLSTVDHLVPHTGNALSPGLEVSLESTAAGLKRSQPNFVTSGIVERFDLRPEVTYPIFAGDWKILPAITARETLYTRSRVPAIQGQAIRESRDGLVRSDFEFALGVKAPVLTRTFRPSSLTRLIGTELRHTIAPELTYRLGTGVSNFARVLRFDATDVASNTNEAEYGVTQHIYRRASRRVTAAGLPCRTAEVATGSGLNTDTSADAAALPPTSKGCPSEELISWRFTQKYFFDRTFGSAIVNNRRNIFETTLNLSGVAFLTEPREISPLISRLRVRTSAHTDIEWDFDLDTGARKFTSSNVFIDLHQGPAFAALSYARLDAPGRFYTQNPTPTPGSAAGVTSSVSDFNQLRVLLGYGSPVKPGLSIAANTGLDLKNLYGATSLGATNTTVYPRLLQYATVQASYNWNCCGFDVEYRKFELGSVRNDGTVRFSFTLANIGTAGNLRRAERLF